MNIIISVLMAIVTITLVGGLILFIYWNLRPLIIAFRHRKKIDNIIKAFKTMNNDDAIEEIIKMGVTSPTMVKIAKQKITSEVQKHDKGISISADEKGIIEEKKHGFFSKKHIFGQPKAADRTGNTASSGTETRTGENAANQGTDQRRNGNFVSAGDNDFKGQRNVQLQPTIKARPINKYFN